MPTTDADGWMEFSVDGQKKKKPMPKVRKLSDKCVAGFDGVWVGGNWSNAGTVTKKESDRYISAVRIYGEIKKEEELSEPFSLHSFPNATVSEPLSIMTPAL